MNRRRNIQHGQKRRMPWSIRIPVTLLIIFTGLLVWEIMFLFGGS